MSKPHDNLPFEQLAQEYNFLNISTYARVLTNLILSEIKQSATPANVLDVGCGKGIGRDVGLQQEIGKVAGEFWGIEPDKTVPAPESLFFNYQHALMETAQLPENHFDVVYSSMVMEHVEYPDQFMMAVKKCLKPGGVYLFLTPNAKSIVPKITHWCRILRIDEMALRLVRSRESVDEYHYPVQFKFNTPQQINKYANQLGFSAPEYAYIEGSGSRGYFSGPLRPIYSLIKLKRQLLKNPNRLATMICRIRKPN
jgi:2-polyprenyl-3-methyl-5-hydroxy-6-metoxy-1,4-benzoquinol methylase